MAGFLDAAASAASAVGDVVDNAASAVTDTVTDVASAVDDAVQEGGDAAAQSMCSIDGGGPLCAVSNVVVGLVQGVVHLVVDVVRVVGLVLRGVGRAIGSLLRLDFPGFLLALGDIVVVLVTELLPLVLRAFSGGYFVGAIARLFYKEGLRQFVERLIKERFESAANPTRLIEARKAVGLGYPPFGFRLKGEHRIFVMDSANVNLAALHTAGTLDLYLLAGLFTWPPSGAGFWPRPRTQVRFVDPNGTEVKIINANRWVLTDFINSGGATGRIRVYSQTQEAAQEAMRTARQRVDALGVRLRWSPTDASAWVVDYQTHEITAAEFAFDIGSRPSGPDLDTVGEYVRAKGLRGGDRSQESTLLALAAFGYDASSFYGITAGREIDGVSPCPTRDRDDGCCNTLKFVETRGQDRVLLGSAVMYRDVYPGRFFKYVLAHECGHYLGLCHQPHTSFANIMWSLAFAKRTGRWVDWNLLHFYLDVEPYFTFEDAKNAWRFIVSQLDFAIVPP